jgi:hypothetical protein
MDGKVRKGWKGEERMERRGTVRKGWKGWKGEERMDK